MSQALRSPGPFRTFNWRAWLLFARRPTSIIALLLLLALAYWTFFGLTQRTLVDDEGISILAAKGILQHGYPLLPSGSLYHRGYIPHYLVAGSIQLFGLNDLSIMLPSLLMGLGSLWLVFIFARNIMGKPWVGVAAVALLLALQLQTIYATGPRMYMALQFFTLLAAYGTWRGFVQGIRKYQLVALLAISAALLSHREGAALLVALPLSTLGVLWMGRREMPSVLCLQNLGGVMLLGAVFLFTFIYQPPNLMTLIAFHGGRSVDHVGFNFGPTGWVNHFIQLQWVFPFGLSFLPVAVFLVIRSMGRPMTNHSYAPTFILLVLIFCAMDHAGIGQDHGERSGPKQVFRASRVADDIAAAIGGGGA